MKFSFTPKEYTRLLELVHLGLHVVTYHQGDEAPGASRYADVSRKLLDLAAPLGCPEMVDIGSDGRPVPSEKLQQDERLLKLIGDYNNDTFWHELVTRLSDRDLASEQTKNAVAGGGGTPIDTSGRLRQLEDAYWDEFEKNDLAHVILLRGGKG